MLIYCLLTNIALRCYTCAYVASSNTNKACLDDPEKVEGSNRYTNCNKKYCTIVRQDLLVSIRKSNKK